MSCPCLYFLSVISPPVPVTQLCPIVSDSLVYLSLPCLVSRRQFVFLLTEYQPAIPACLLLDLTTRTVFLIPSLPAPCLIPVCSSTGAPTLRLATVLRLLLPVCTSACLTAFLLPNPDLFLDLPRRLAPPLRGTNLRACGEKDSAGPTPLKIPLLIYSVFLLWTLLINSPFVNQICIVVLLLGFNQTVTGLIHTGQLSDHMHCFYHIQ